MTLTGISENTTYYFILRDEDPSGNTSQNTSVVSYGTGDLTAPTFAGIVGISVGSPTDTSIVPYWTAITSQPTDMNGATAYLIYMTSKDYYASPNTPDDPCTSGSLVTQLAATSFTSGQTASYAITGLTARTNYRVCVKARDAAGNTSVNTANASIDSRTTRDITAPSFDGLQTLTYNSGQARVDATWNASTSSDILEYKIKIWKVSQAGVTSSAVNLTRSHASYSTGFNFNSSDITLADQDTVYAVVQACDNASPTFGTQNCTTYADGTARNVYIPDLTAPASFFGIKDSSNLSSPSEGAMAVSWFAPTSWVDYRGFNVYLVNGSNQLIDQTGTTTSNPIKVCACSGANCPDQITSCTVTGLDAFRTYTFHVRAYDSQGNTTSYLSPASSKSAKRTLDTTSPTFSSNIVTAYAGGVSLGWSAATDNQYASESGATINYQIWRKAASTFGTPTNPALDGTSAGSTTALVYTDSVTNLASGQTYYYTLCALDASTNKTCDGNVGSRFVPDVAPPAFSGLTDSKTTTNKIWNITWSMSDNITPTNAIAIDAWRLVSASSTTFPSTTASVYITQAGLTAITGETSVTGTANQEIYVNYLIRATDQNGNTVTATRSIFIDELAPTTPAVTLLVAGSPVANGATIATLSPVTFTGTCDSTNANGNVNITSISASTTAVNVRGITCAAGALAATATIMQSAGGPQQVAITFNTTDSRGNNSMRAVTYTQNFWCPTNYLGVVKHPSATGVTADFCVAKYEMKAVTVGGTLVNGGNGQLPSTQALASLTATSRPDGTPWTQLPVTGASFACTSLGSGYALPTNDQWQNMAWDIEGVSTNWAWNSIGASTGGIYRGHYYWQQALADAAVIDPDGAGALIALGFVTSTGNTTLGANYQNVVDDSNPYIGTLGSATGTTFNGAGNTTAVNALAPRRTHNLSTGGVIWDLSGNVGEWINPATTCVYPVTNSVEVGSGSAITSMTGFVKALYGPLNTYGAFSSSHRLGRILRVTGSGNNYCIRGSAPSNDAISSAAGDGSETLSLFTTGWRGLTGGGGFPAQGFRCVYQP